MTPNNQNARGPAGSGTRAPKKLHRRPRKADPPGSSLVAGEGFNEEQRLQMGEGKSSGVEVQPEGAHDNAALGGNESVGQRPEPNNQDEGVNPSFDPKRSISNWNDPSLKGEDE